MTEMLESIKSDLLSRRMLPLLAAVAVALVGGTAYALSASSPGGASPSPVPSVSPPPAASTLSIGVASVNAHAALAETPGGKRFQSQGSTRNPFASLAPVPAAKSGTTGPSGSSTGSNSSGSSSTGSSSTGSSPGGAGVSGGSSTGAGTGVPPTPVLPKPKPIHVGLSPTQSYSVALSLTTAAGGLDTVDSLERLSVLPSGQQPLLVYLGVLKGGRDTLFVVQPGTVVSGPGVCLPGPTDCEILSLAQEQIESLAVSTGSGTSNVALFAVNAITVEGHASVASANRARRKASAAGSALLGASTLPALPLFEYQPHAGAVVDLRSLTVGGK